MSEFLKSAIHIRPPKLRAKKTTLQKRTTRPSFIDGGTFKHRRHRCKAETELIQLPFEAARDIFRPRN